MDSFLDVIERLRQGDNDAAAHVARRFVHRLVALASEQFETRIRVRADVEDVVQSVYQSFFMRFEAGQFDLANWESVWGLLALMTVRKCANRREFLQAARRDARREVAYGDIERSLGPVDREPTSQEVAQLSEVVEQMLRRLEPPERAIVELCLRGCVTREIARQLGRSERTVRRVLEHVRRSLIQSLADPPSE